MKRPFRPRAGYLARVGLVDLDFTNDQLAGIGRVAMAYNEAEGVVVDLLQTALELDNPLFTEVASRINGIDGVIAIILRAAQRARLTEPELAAFREALGNAGFSLYKRYRDAVIHARSYNAPAGIGYRVERRATAQEVLLTVPALTALADHTANMVHEIESLFDILVDRRQIAARPDDDPDKAQAEEYMRECLARYLDCRNQRRALPPIPAFPEESELLLARERWKGPLASLEDWRPKPESSE